MSFFRKRELGSPYGFFSAFDFCVPGLREFIGIIAFFLLGLLLSFALSFVAGMYLPGSADYMFLISYPLMFIPPMLYASVVSRRNAGFVTGYAVDSSNFGKYRGVLVGVLVSLMTVSTAYVSELFTKPLPPVPDALQKALEQLSGGPVWISLLAVSVFAPLFEEWLCRGMVLRGLLQRMKPVWAIVLSALFFAVIHLNPWQGIPAFCMGCVFGYVYYRTGSLKLTMLMHCVNNTLSVIMANIPALKGYEHFWDILEPCAYWLNFSAAVLVIASGIVLLHGIPLPEGERSACRRID